MRIRKHFSKFHCLVEVGYQCLLRDFGTSDSESSMDNDQVSEEEDEEEEVDLSFLDRVPRGRRSGDVPIETPVWLDQVMEKLGGGASNPKLIFEKTLFETDRDPSQGRLSLPSNQLISNDFLTRQERRMIERDINHTGKTGVRALVVDQRSKKWEVMLKRWELKKRSGHGSWSYVLTAGWNKIVKDRGLKAEDTFSIWSFRWRGILCFALVPPHPSTQKSFKLPRL